MRKSKVGRKTKKANTRNSRTRKIVRTTRSSKAATIPTKHRSEKPKGTASATLVETGYKVRDQEIERILIAGRHEGLLEEYFGQRDYRELRELAQQSSRRSVRGGPRVLIYPGLWDRKLGAKVTFYLMMLFGSIR